MKRIRNYLIGLWGDSPFIFWIIIFLIMLAIYKPAQDLISSYFSKDIALSITVYSILAMIGILGIIMIVRKEAPIILIPIIRKDAPTDFITIQGLPAIIIGFFLAAVGFGGIIWGIIRDIFSLRLP
jgi:hypothetical protein